MSDQLEARLSTLREAGDQIHYSTLQIGDSVSVISAVRHELTALGYDNPANGSSTQLFYAETQLSHCLDNLHLLKNQLQQTVDAIEGASVAHFPPLGRLWRPVQNRANPIAPVPAAALTTVAFDPGRYVSTVNQPLYDSWRQERDALVSQQAHLVELRSSRIHLVDDLRALSNRLASTPGTSMTAGGEVARLQGQIGQIDDQIKATQGEVARLQGNVDTLTTRLERVAPGEGANLFEINHWEHSESSAGLKMYTEGCVNYIVHRIPIPAALGVDAHLWNDIAAQNPQYGIRAGDVPLVGSVLVMERGHSYADDLYGHVMYVERVEGGEVWITDNLHAEPIPLSDLTAETSGANLTYLILPWHTQG